MTAKIKTKKAGIASREDYENQVNAWAELEARRRELEAAQDAEIAAVLKKRAAELLNITNRQDELAAACGAYAAAHADELLPAGKKSAETALATWGFKKGRAALALLDGHTWEGVLEAIKNRGRAWVNKYLTTPAPALNKNAIKDGLTPEQLAAVGCCIEQSETFYIKAK